MNKLDIILIIVVLTISCIFFLLFNKDNGSNAIVTYDGNEILNIDLSLDKTYTVSGYNGDVLIEVKNGKIRVLSENSPRHLCSKQGYIQNSDEMIVCLPNKIVIEVINDKSNMDSVVK